MINWGHIDRNYQLMGQKLRIFIKVEKKPTGTNQEDNKLIRDFIDSYGLNPLKWNDSFALIEKRLADATKEPQLSTYIRKYYLHRQIKKAGFGLKLEQTHKTIDVPHNMVHLASENKYVLELQKDYNYGVQTSIV